MFDFIRTYQLNIMLGLSASCMTVAFLLFVTRFLPKRRKQILILMEFIATFLLFFDRLAYMYAGRYGQVGYVMVRITNFMVFFLTSAIVLGFNLFLMDYLSREGEMKVLPKRLLVICFVTVLGMFMVVVSHFTGLYYYFDSGNHYHRGPGFLLAYVVPVICPIVQYTVIVQYKKVFRPLIYIGLTLYIFVPIIVGIIQIFTYGLSIVNMSMVLVSLGLYIFTYLDINDEVERVHRAEIDTMREEKKSMRRLFEQTAIAFIGAIEKRDGFLQGRSMRVANLAKSIAKEAGKSEELCDEVYYSALLNDVGLIDIPDDLIGKEGSLNEDEDKVIKTLPIISSEVLSEITVYPYLSKNVRSTHENYDGSGFPDGLKGEEIPDASRIISVAGSYDYLTNAFGERGALPEPFVREELIKEAGGRFDPEYAGIMLQMMDADTNRKNSSGEEDEIENALKCDEYRKKVTTGIPIQNNVVEIRFKSAPLSKDGTGYSAPSIILFDSYDKRVHDNEKAIEAYRYYEYGELWFDGHSIATHARSIKVDVEDYEVHDGANEDPEEDTLYEIIASRYEDHMRLIMENGSRSVDIIVALPDRTRYCFIGITGENCDITDIEVVNTDKEIGEGDIPRIADEINFIDRFESDIPNVQIDRTRSASTQGIPIKDRLRLEFHTMSLPSSDLVWHCPYIVLYYSDDQKIGGPNYMEYAMIKLNGEDNGSNEFAENRFNMKRGEIFGGWDKWKERNKAGLECDITFVRKGNNITLYTENLGISIENTTKILSGKNEVYVALTGDQIALTDIRIR